MYFGAFWLRTGSSAVCTFVKEHRIFFLPTLRGTADRAHQIRHWWALISELAASLLRVGSVAVCCIWDVLMVLARWLKACCTWNSVASYIVIWQHEIFSSMTNELSRSETLVSLGTSTRKMTSLVTDAATALISNPSPLRAAFTHYLAVYRTFQLQAYQF